MQTALLINLCIISQLVCIISQLKCLFVAFLVSSVFTTSYFHFAAGELALLQVLLYVDSKGEEVRGGREGGSEGREGGKYGRKREEL